MLRKMLLDVRILACGLMHIQSSRRIFVEVIAFNWVFDLPCSIAMGFPNHSGSPAASMLHFSCQISKQVHAGASQPSFEPAGTELIA